MSENTAVIIFRIIGLTLTYVSACVSILFFALTWYLGPESSPPMLQYALLSLIVPALMLLFTLLARPLGNIAHRGFIAPSKSLHATTARTSVLENQPGGG